jgi:hypothetical protein
MRALSSTAVLAALAVSACDPLWVKERSLLLRTVDENCVGSALHSVPGIVAERHRSDPVLFYLRRKDTSEPGASIGAPTSGAKGLIFLVNPRIDPQSPQSVGALLDTAADSLRKACGGA